MNTPEINELLRLVEERYGSGLNTSTDFECFSLHLKKGGFGEVSGSTLKRLWGYVGDKHVPRVATLDILSRTLGHDSYASFSRWLRTSPDFNSSFFTADQLMSSSLEEGMLIRAGWAPNRLLTLQYLGGNEYEVKESVNSKLMEGDRFVCASFIKGSPLYLPYVLRSGEKTPPFIAGRNGGLSCIESCRENERK